MFELKPLSKDGIEGALAKAERYRLLNEPGEAESICLDVLEVDPEDQRARIGLLLALSDQVADAAGAGARAEKLAAELEGEYDRLYYGGLVAERRGKAHLHRGGVMTPHGAYEWLTEALTFFDRAGRIRPPGNDDAILRWNACVRVLRQHPHLQPGAGAPEEPQFLE
ncbi:hypothetical protein BH24ACI4_BH24ACI4_12750 [soil metagenome]|jgi:hypothetical protein|nr:hypothetical protein [Acidobacteriota bacterium]